MLGLIVSACFLYGIFQVSKNDFFGIDFFHSKLFFMYCLERPNICKYLNYPSLFIFSLPIFSHKNTRLLENVDQVSISIARSYTWNHRIVPFHNYWSDCAVCLLNIYNDGRNYLTIGRTNNNLCSLWMYVMRCQCNLFNFLLFPVK